MEKTTLKSVKKGEFFTFKPIENPSENQVYIKDNYDRETKKYSYYKFSDINRFGEKKGTTIVYTGFTF